MSRPRRGRRLRRGVERAAYVLCLALVGGALALLVAERTGLLRHAARTVLVTQLGGAADRVELDGVEVHWSDPGLSLRGLRVLDDHGVVAEIDALELRWRPFHARRLHAVALGGRLHAGPDLYTALEALRLGYAGAREGEAVSDAPPTTPDLTVLGLAVVAGPRAAPTALGRLDVWLRARRGTPARLLGRLQPPTDAAAEPVWLRGRSLPDGSFEVRTSLDGLALSRATLGPELCAALEPYALPVAGRLSAHARAWFVVDGSAPPRGELALGLEGLATASPRPELVVEGLDAGATLRFDPHPGESLLSDRAWSGSVRASGRWRESPVELALDLAERERDDLLAELSAHVERLPADGPTERLLLAVLPRADVAAQVERAFRAVETEGVCELWLGARQARLGPGDELNPEIAFEIDPTVGATVTFFGWEGSDGLRNGFPIPAEVEAARLAFAHDPSRARQDRFAMIDVRARHPRGEVLLSGAIESPRPTAPTRRPHIRVDLELPSFPVSPELEQGLAGLHAGIDVWALLNPSAGTLAARFVFDQRPEHEGVLIAGDIEFDALSGSSELLPVPFEGVEGEARLRWAERPARPGEPGGDRARRGFGLGFDVRGQLASEPDADLRLRAALRDADDSGDTRLEDLELALGPVAVGGPTWEQLLDRRPELADAADRSGARGTIAIAYRETAALESVARVRVLEVRPEALEIAPLDGLAPTVGLVGALSSWREGGSESALEPGAGVDAAAEGPESERLRAVVAGQLEPSRRVAVAARLDADGAFVAEGAAAGFDLDAPPPSLLALAPGLEAVAAPGPEARGRADLELAARGTVDGDVALDRARLHLRDNVLRLPELRVSELRGRVDLAPSRAASDRLRFRVADSEVELRDLDVRVLAPGAPAPTLDPRLVRPGFLPASEDGGLVAIGSLWFEDLPLDRRHLAPAFDDALLDDFLQRSRWRGRLDARGARLALAVPGDGPPRFALTGPLVPHDLFVDVGVPLRVGSCRVQVEHLAGEDGSLRAWFRVEELYGRVAGHSISDAGAIASYAEGRLALDALEARVAGGRVASPAGNRAGTALAVELRPPYRFDLALELEGVQVDELLAPLADSGARDSGRLGGSVRLAGRPDALDDLVGSGFLRLSDARLWSIPVVREVFSRLGFDATATFDTMRTAFRVEDGAVWMDDTRVHSPLLELWGGGRIGLEGDVRQEFEVRYSLIEELGPFGTLLHWLQNQLATVRVRGNLARPVVQLGGLLSGLVSGAGDELAVPLPPPTVRARF